MMFHQLFVCLTVGLISVSQRSDAAACDSEIVARIQSLWNQFGVPQNILANNVAASPDYLVSTTKGYLEGESDVTCSKTYWKQDSNGYAFRSETLRKNRPASEGKWVSVTEKGGITYNEDGNRVVYHIPTSDKVSAFYACSNDAANGLPEGVVKVNEGYSEEAKETAERRLEQALGRKLESKFADRC